MAVVVPVAELMWMRAAFVVFALVVITAIGVANAYPAGSLNRLSNGMYVLPTKGFPAGSAARTFTGWVYSYNTNPIDAYVVCSPLRTVHRAPCAVYRGLRMT